MDGGDHEWELSKENVQPLRQGRHISSLVAALNPEQSEEHMIKTQRNNFELELRTYSGDDPFSVWDSYIKWNEQYFPKGGHDGQLLKLLERCLREFQADERYTNDSRFIHIWIKFACLTEDPVIIFSYMFDNGIGVNVAAFYVEWALSLERKGDNSRADVIYLEALNRCAEPKDLIVLRHKQFQSRLARNITVQIAEGHNPGMNMGDDVDKRATLGRLKSSGSSHKVGTVRTGNIKLGSAGSLKDSRTSIQKQVPNRGLPVYQDAENVLPSLAPQQSNEWHSLPVQAVDNRENNKMPSVWTDAKLKQRSGTSTSVNPAIPFVILEDPNNVPHETPKKTTLINTQPLSSIKASQTDVLSSLRRPTSGTYIMEIPMYQKDKIYNGVSEFSFEELRTIKYWKFKKAREEEAARMNKEAEQRLKEETMQRQLLQVTEQLTLLQAQVSRFVGTGPADQQLLSQPNQTQQLLSQPHQTQQLLSQPHQAQQLLSQPHQAQQQRQASEKQELNPISSTYIQLKPEFQSTAAAAATQNQTSQDVSQPPRQESGGSLGVSQPPRQDSVGSSGVSQQPRQESVVDISNNSASNSFITPTNMIANLTESHEKPGAPQCSSAKGSLRKPIFNSASTYSSGSSFRHSQSQPRRAGVFNNSSSLESSIVSSSGGSGSIVSSSGGSGNIAHVSLDDSSDIRNHAQTISAQSNTNDVTPMGKMYPPADSSIIASGFSSHSKLNHTGTPGLNQHTPGSQSGFTVNQSLTAPSPTVHTKEAMKCVMGMFSTSFSCDDHLMTEELDALHGTSSKIPFEICADTTETIQTERQSLKTASEKRGLGNVCYESVDGKENVLKSTLSKPQATTKSIGGMVLDIYRDEPEDKGICGGRMMEIYRDEPENKGRMMEIYRDEPENKGRMMEIYRDEPENKGRMMEIYRDEPENKGRMIEIYRDEPENKGRRMEIYQDEPENKGRMMEIYRDEPENKGRRMEIYRDEPENTAANVGTNGVCIYHDIPQDRENEVKVTSVKRNVRRGLGFSVYDDVEMVDVDKEYQPLTSDLTFVYGARNDTTIAGLDSFNVHAKFASTPFFSSQDKTRSKVQELGATGSVSSNCLITSSSSVTNLINDDTNSSKNLSPIFEGSGEGSAEESKSCQQSQTAGQVCPSGRSLPQQDSEPMEAETESNRDISMCEDMHQDPTRGSCYHEIDITTYITPELNQKTEALVSASVCLDHTDPFDDRTIERLLKNLNPAILEYPNFVPCFGQMPDMSKDCFLILENTYLTVLKCIGEGGYAKIYTVCDHTLSVDETISLSSADQVKVIKVQTPPCQWEFYVSCELRRRLTNLRSPMNIIPSIMEIMQGYFFENGSILLMSHASLGSLLNLVNTYKDNRTLMAGVEPYACLLTIELLHMFEQIHKCDFIHGDVKPDNFLLLGFPHIMEGCTNPELVFGSRLRLVQLIDFGQSIDMTMFPRDTTFMAKVLTSDFQCIEMRTNRPWTFQTDLFGLVGTIHVVLFGTYMKVFQEQGIWRVTGNFVRKWNVPLWKHLFKELLNVSSCDRQPDLSSLRAEFEKYFIDNLIPAYNSWTKEIKSLQTCD